MKSKTSGASVPRSGLRLDKVEVIVNPRSGSVNEAAPAELKAELEARGIGARIHVFDGHRFDALLDDAFAAKPDLVIVLAGDGTVRAVASRAGPDGPMVVPLPGGTMNMLPKAVYGVTDWRRALALAVDEGEVRDIAGGVVDGEPFYCAAILGPAALWAPAREALRKGRIVRSLAKARGALRAAFAGRVRYRLDRGELKRAEALVLISPLISTAMKTSNGLEAAVMKTSDAREAFRLATNAVFSDWRNDPSVETQVVKRAHAWSRSKIPALLDGETVRLSTDAEIRFLPVAFRALAPRSVTEEAAS
ncbi:MAG: NAD(+)/NADH kinase [Caulobacterales bacterium]|nr:NAD(+)/NADH kinase [Caulobacterales bacterium]